MEGFSKTRLFIVAELTSLKKKKKKSFWLVRVYIFLGDQNGTFCKKNYWTYQIFSNIMFSTLLNKNCTASTGIQQTTDYTTSLQSVVTYIIGPETR